LKGAQVSLSCATKLPPKRGGRAGPKSPGAGTTEHTESFQGGFNFLSTHSKQSSISVQGEEETSTLAIHHGPAKTDSKSRLVSLSSQENDEPMTKKWKKAKKVNSDNTGISNVSTRTPIHVQGGGGESLSAPCVGGSPKRAKVLSNKTDTGDLQIKMVVNDGIDRVADEIHHCAFIFDLTKRPKVIINSKNSKGSSEETSAAPNITHCALKALMELYSQL
jgi:hypothetical protein